MFKGPKENLDEHMGKLSREVETIKKNTMEILELKNIITKM